MENTLPNQHHATRETEAQAIDFFLNTNLGNLQFESPGISPLPPCSVLVPFKGELRSHMLTPCGF